MGNSEVNKIFVEGAPDEAFFKHIMTTLGITNTTITSFHNLKGKDDLKNAMALIKKGELNKIGVIVDADEVGIAQRVSEISTIIKEKYSDINIIQENTLYTSAVHDVEIGVHVLNVNGKGELTTLLRTISSKETIFAKCLDQWKNCYVAQGKHISDNDFDKIWVSTYIRMDAMTESEKRDALVNNRLDIAITKDYWDYEHDSLEQIKFFLKLFAS